MKKERQKQILDWNPVFLTYYWNWTEKIDIKDEISIEKKIDPLFCFLHLILVDQLLHLINQPPQPLIASPEVLDFAVFFRHTSLKAKIGPALSEDDKVSGRVNR